MAARYEVFTADGGAVGGITVGDAVGGAVDGVTVGDEVGGAVDGIAVGVEDDCVFPEIVLNKTTPPTSNKAAIIKIMETISPELSFLCSTGACT
jgi:hypothetical protein